MEKKYEVLYKKKGIKKKVTVVAETKKDAINQVSLKTGGEIIIVQEAPEELEDKIKKIFLKIKNNFFKKKISVKDLIGLFKQVAVMVKAGMSITDALRESVSTMKNKRLKFIIEDSIIKIESGQTFNESLQQYIYEIGVLPISMIRMGEETGELAEALYDLNEILEEMDMNKRRIKKAMRQPIITMGVLILAMVGLIMMVVPKFKSIFANFGSELPAPTQWLIFLSDSFHDYGLYIIVSMGLIFFIHSKSKALNKKYEYNVDKFKFNMKIFGNIIKYGMVARFVSVFNKLMKTGVNVSEAVDTATNTVDNIYLKRKLEKIQQDFLNSKGTLSEIFDETGLFESMDIKMIETGENSGELTNMLDHVSNKYKEDFKDIVENLSSLIEPILLAVVTVMVLFLALGIFLPMWDLASAVKH